MSPRARSGAVLTLLMVLSAGCNKGCNQTTSDDDAGVNGGTHGSSTSGGNGSGASASGGSGSHNSTASNGSGASNGGGADGGASGAVGNTSSSGGNVRDAGPSVTGLEVAPEPAVINAVPGMGGNISLVVTAVLADGTRRPAVNPFFRSLNAEIGVMVNDVFQASGTRGGNAAVRIRAEGLETMHSVSVHVREAVVDPGSPPDLGGQFGGPIGDPLAAPTMAYPLDQAVIPLNLSPILFQWRTPMPVYGYHLRVEGAHGSLDLYTVSDRVEPLRDPWRRLLDSHSGEVLNITLESVESPGGTRHVTAQQTLTLARADLTATVYYWALNVGRIVRIDATSVSPTVLPLTGSSYTDANGTHECYACHTLSKDGTRLAFTTNGGSGPGAIVNPNNPGTNLIGPGPTGWNSAAISPDNARIMTNIGNQLHVLDTTTGAELPGSPVASNAAHPAWSPVGNLVAYASSITGNEIDFTTADLTVQTIDPVTGMLGSVVQTVPGDGLAPYYPNFSPAGTHVIFNRGGATRSANGATRHPATLELLDVNAGGTPTVLSRATPNMDGHLATFSPFVEGGYMWVAFFSLRDYGIVTTDKRQIWVFALDQNPVPGVDPSHPGFWLPGQDTTTQNMSSFFAPAPCVDAGAQCTSDLSCCNGNLCRPNAGGTLVCTPPDQACGLPGDMCSLDTDCCAGAGPCFDDGSGIKTCTPPGEQCHLAGQTCQFDDDCCLGQGTCFGGTGVFLCTPINMQCVQNLASCMTTMDCCPGAGDCALNPQTGTLACLRMDQQCRAPMQTCTTTADCCMVMNAACLPNATTGTLECLRPMDQCRAEGQGCTNGSTDCCGGLLCDQSVCVRVGG